MTSLRGGRGRRSADVADLVDDRPGLVEDLHHLEVAGQRRDPEWRPAVVVHPEFDLI